MPEDLVTSGLSMPPKLLKRARKRARELYGPAAFSRYVRMLIEVDLATADQKPAKNAA